jgi:hypothetical protein
MAERLKGRRYTAALVEELMAFGGQGGRSLEAGSDGLRARCESGCANDRVSVPVKGTLRSAAEPGLVDLLAPDVPEDEPHDSMRPNVATE